MKKKWIALAMAGIMAVSALTGCGGGKEAASAGTGEASAASTEAGSAESQPAEAPESQGEAPTVTWCVFGNKQQDLDKVMEDLNKKLVEKINVKLNLEVIPQGEFNDKMKLKSTAGEDYDLVFTSNWLNSITDNMSREAFMPLDELFAEYGQDIKAAMPEWLLDVGKVNGQLYAVPNQQIIARQLGVAIQKEYAEKYGFDKTSLSDIRDLEPFLEAIAKNEPNMFPIDERVCAVVEKDYEGVVSVGASAGNNGDCVLIRKDDSEAALLSVTEVISDQLKLDNEWYQKGYLRKDIATVMDNTADVKANRYVCTLSSYKPGWDAEMTTRQGVEYITVPIDGIYVKAISGSETMTAINVNSKNSEAAMKLLNLIYTDKEIFNELLYGIEGEHYTKTGENSVELTTSPADSKYTFSGYGWMLGNQFNAYYMPGQAEGLWEETDKLNREAEISPLRGFVFDPTNVQSEMAQVGAVVKEYANGQFTAKDIDSYIAERNAKMEQAGLSAIMEETQKQIDAWKSTK